MAKINAIDNKTGELTIDPGASGDSFIQFDINTTGEFRIGVDDTDDSFRISQGSALGTNDTFVATATGNVANPLKSCFQANVTGALNNVTGDGTTYTILFGTTVFDLNSDFSSPTFTAPVTGKFFFGAIIQLLGTAGQTAMNMRIVTSNRTYTQGYINQSAVADVTAVMSTAGCCITDMDATDTATIVIYSAGGAKVVDVNIRTYFYGVLLA